jgi:molecular chaperone GrpE
MPEHEVQPAFVSLSRYEELAKAKEELLDLLLRRQAEFENMRRRTEKEKGEFQEYALSHFISKLLPLLDGLERGIHSPTGESVESFKQGLALLLRQFRDILSTTGVQPIVAVGEPFDPNLHFAVMKEEAEGVAENQILEEFQCGYLFKDRLLRPSMVKVAASAHAGSAAPAPEAEMPEAPTLPGEKPE